jgi:hypothetical protein
LKENVLRRSKVDAQLCDENASVRRERLDKEIREILMEKEEVIRRTKCDGASAIEEANKRAERKRLEL